MAMSHREGSHERSYQESSRIEGRVGVMTGRLTSERYKPTTRPLSCDTAEDPLDTAESAATGAAGALHG